MTESSATDNRQNTMVFEVAYTHETLSNSDELYYTEFGLPLRECQG